MPNILLWNDVLKKVGLVKWGRDGEDTLWPSNWSYQCQRLFDELGRVVPKLPETVGRDATSILRAVRFLCSCMLAPDFESGPNIRHNYMEDAVRCAALIFLLRTDEGQALSSECNLSEELLHRVDEAERLKLDPVTNHIDMYPFPEIATMLTTTDASVKTPTDSETAETPQETPETQDESVATEQNSTDTDESSDEEEETETLDSVFAAMFRKHRELFSELGSGLTLLRAHSETAQELAAGELQDLEARVEAAELRARTASSGQSSSHRRADQLKRELDETQKRLEKVQLECAKEVGQRADELAKLRKENKELMDESDVTGAELAARIAEAKALREELEFSEFVAAAHFEAYLKAADEAYYNGIGAEYAHGYLEDALEDLKVMTAARDAHRQELNSLEGEVRDLKKRNEELEAHVKALENVNTRNAELGQNLAYCEHAAEQEIKVREKLTKERDSLKAKLSKIPRFLRWVCGVRTDS